MVPLLNIAPVAQNELVMTFRAVTLFDSKFQSAPHAECPLICKGSSDARSKKSARVGETIIASRATMPDVSSLRSKRHSGAAAAALEHIGASKERNERARSFMLL